MKRIVVILLSLALLGLVLAAGYRFSRMGDQEMSASSAGTRLLALTLPDLDTLPQALSQWRGQVLVVNYWATWCAPCRKEMPGFARLQNKYAGKGVQFVGISIDDADKVREFQSRIRVPYPLLIGGPESLAVTVELGNATMGLPFTVVIDQKGQVARTRLGLFNEQNLDELLTATLASGAIATGGTTPR